MTDLLEIYERNLANSGKLKLRATRQLAEGTADAIFEACVLLHEAARIERRSVEALPSPSAVTRLAAAIEECACLLEGRDLPGAAKARERILREIASVEEPTASALIEPIEQRFQESYRQFGVKLLRCATLMHLRGEGVIVPASIKERKAALRELRGVLSEFPGDPSFWWMAYRLAEPDDKRGAWEALMKASRLDPANPRFLAMSLLLAATALPVDEADGFIARVRASLDTKGPEVCLMYAHAELSLESKDHSRQRWMRARDAVIIGFSQARTERLRKSLHATQLVLESLLAGNEPTLDILYTVGLGEVAASAPPESNVVDLVARLAKQRVSQAELSMTLAA